MLDTGGLGHIDHRLRIIRELERQALRLLEGLARLPSTAGNGIRDLRVLRGATRVDHPDEQAGDSQDDGNDDADEHEHLAADVALVGRLDRRRVLAAVRGHDRAVTRHGLYLQTPGARGRRSLLDLVRIHVRTPFVRQRGLCHRRLALGTELELLRASRDRRHAGRRPRDGRHVRGVESRRHHLLEIGQQRLEGRITVLRIKRQHLHHKVVDLRREPGTDLARLLGRTLKALADDRRRIGTLERSHAAERMVDRAAKGVHVSAIVDRLLLHLLGSDVVRRTPDLIRVLLHRRKTEVDELRIAVRIQQHVLRLHVAVHQTLVRRATKRLGDLLADLHHTRHIGIRARVLHDLKEGASRHELHRDVGHPVVDVVGVDLRDVRMNEPRTGLRLLLELLHELGIAAVFLEHHLDGHRTV